MSKKCTICGAEAHYHIKDSSEYYCEECAQESFGDLALLERVDDTHKDSGDLPAPDEEED